jgi:hypothetical protein
MVDLIANHLGPRDISSSHCLTLDPTNLLKESQRQITKKVLEKNITDLCLIHFSSPDAFESLFFVLILDA